MGSSSQRLAGSAAGLPLVGEVARWRENRLLRAGFEQPLARRTATEHAIDLHALIELVERGCPPELAVRILAPLDGEGPR